MKKKYTKINLGRIKNIKWYRQGADGKLLYLSYPLTACHSFRLQGKAIPYYYKNLFGYIANGKMIDWLDKKELKKVANYYLNKQKKNKKFIKDLKKFWQKEYFNSYLRTVKILENKNLKNLNNQELVLQFNNFSKIYMLVWRESIFHDAFDVYGEKILNNILLANKLILSSQELELLLSNQKPSPLQQERLDNLKLLKIILINKRLYNLVKNNKINEIKKIFPLFYQKLINHSRKYHWLHNDYIHIEELDEKFFLSNLKNIVLNKKLFQEEKLLRNNLSKIKRKRVQLIKDKKISVKILNIIDFLIIITRWRDERKMASQMANSLIYKFIKEFAERIKIDYRLLENLFWSEIGNIFDLSKKDLEILNKRKDKGLLYFIYNKKEYIIVGNKERKKTLALLNKNFINIKKLTGSPAYPGKMKGKVKIIFGKKDFSKLKSGEILVTANTRPEFVPIMKKAGAIISEEGGITCHASIVSRELKKIAIVGVQGVLNILKDGDMVEVDANKGIIKKI